MRDDAELRTEQDTNVPSPPRLVPIPLERYTAPSTLSRRPYPTQNSLNLTGLRNNSNGNFPAGITPIPPPGFAASFVVRSCAGLRALASDVEE